MQLFLDLGNSRVHWGVLDKQQWLASGEVAYQELETWQPPDLHIAQIYLASVTSQQNKSKVIAYLQQYWSVRPKIITTQSQAFGVSNAYQQPELLGVDRWLALVASHYYYQGFSCIIDCGTAITVDGLQADGLHLGGWILPGIGLMRQSLLENTAQLNWQAMTTDLMFANNTEAAIENGIQFAVIAMIRQLYQQFDQPPTLILTGGDAMLLQAHLAIPVNYDKLLVLKGLALVAQYQS